MLSLEQSSKKGNSSRLGVLNCGCFSVILFSPSTFTRHLKQELLRDMQATRTSVHRTVRNCRRVIQRLRLTSPPREADLLERCRRATLVADHHSDRYDRVAEERDELRRQVADLQAEVIRLTDENTALRRPTLEVSGVARHAS